MKIKQLLLLLIEEQQKTNVLLQSIEYRLNQNEYKKVEYKVTDHSLKKEDKEKQYFVRGDYLVRFDTREEANQHADDLGVDRSLVAIFLSQEGSQRMIRKMN